jgi:hypothetical protein
LCARRLETLTVIGHERNLVNRAVRRKQSGDCVQRVAQKVQMQLHLKGLHRPHPFRLMTPMQHNRMLDEAPR